MRWPSPDSPVSPCLAASALWHAAEAAVCSQRPRWLCRGPVAAPCAREGREVHGLSEGRGFEGEGWLGTKEARYVGGGSVTPRGGSGVWDL